MSESPYTVDEDEVRRQFAGAAAACQALRDITSLREELRKSGRDMIRIRVKPNHVTVRIGSASKQRYASAIHALHVIRVAVVEQGAVIEETRKTEFALIECISRARAELEAAIGDIAPVQKRRMP